MAFDISLDESGHQVEPAPADFAEFYATKAEVVAATLALICVGSGEANDATAAALTRSSQRWNHLADHENPAGWAINAGVEQCEKTRRDGTPGEMNQATGGYVRGLTLAGAFATLPMHQRAALVTGYYLDWSDSFTAAGFETPVSTIRTRRERAVSFIGHHLRLDKPEVIALVRTHLSELSEQDREAPPAMLVVRRRGRRRTVRNRLGAGILAAAIIVTGGALFQAGGEPEVAAGPVVVQPPSTSSRWFGPVSDGRGAFVALNTSGASRFIGSRDGSEWVALTTWNSRAVDLRGEVSSFVRTGGEYIAVIEIPATFNTFVAPFIATSVDLRDWNVRQLDVSEPALAEGLRGYYNVVASAASGDHVLIALESREELDYRSFGIRPDAVCVESSTSTQRQYSLCDGETITVATNTSNRTQYFRATGAGAFVEVALPADVVARSIAGFDGGFAVVDSNLGHVWTSVDGREWQRSTSSEQPNRFVLIEGSDAVGAGALVIEPDATGWRSQVVAPSGLGVAGTIPLDALPSGVWTPPDVSSGPAGWAMFVTTSRPWERVGATRGWAVESGDWIVSQLPDADTITAQSTEGSTTLRFTVESEWVQVDDNNTIVLLDPQSGSVLVEITAQDIDQARPTALDESRTKAQVFFSADGIEWRSVWSSTDDAWFGSVAVGDNELLLSGTQLTGGPITIPLDS